MAKKLTANLEVIADTRNLANVLAGMKVKLPNGLDSAKVLTHVAATQAIHDKLEALNLQVAKAVDERRAAVLQLRKDTKEIRTGVKAMFGDDSAEYAMVGGTRASERKKPGKK